MAIELDRARRMVDVGMEEAENTFNLGKSVTKEEIQQIMQELGFVEDESE